MARRLRYRFWIESILGSGAGILTLVTIIRRDWIESIFGIDPDKGNGSIECLTVIILIIITVSLAVGAHMKWCRPSRNELKSQISHYNDVLR